MSRKPRIYRPGAFYHVMLRGNNGQPIFFEDKDKCRLCLLIQEGIQRFGYRIHSFCFMNNHIHLVLQIGESTISQSIHHLAFRYTRYINRKEKRVGHLFQGRFKAILIDDRNYLLELIRYVHLNPVRAGIVTKPESYRWCSHRAYLGLEMIPWLTQESILQKFDSHEDTSRAFYDRSGKEREGAQTRALIYFIRMSPHLTLKEFATLVRRDISALSKLAVTIENKTKSDQQLAEVVGAVTNLIESIQIAKSQA